jgi:hypothetical protein
MRSAKRFSPSFPQGTKPETPEFHARDSARVERVGNTQGVMEGTEYFPSK